MLFLRIKLLAVRMNVGNSGFWIAIGIGGAVIGIMSFVQQYTSTDINQEIRLRAVFRDFCIGAFLTAMIYMFLPDSIDSLVSSGKSFFTGGGTSSIMRTTTTDSFDIELQTGPARF